MTLRLGGDGAITGCTSLENPDLTVSGLTISGSFDAEKVLVASGTAAAPSYTFSGDTDNGLYYAGTNSIGVSTAGTSAIVVDASQNVGIGTSSQRSLSGYTSVGVDGTSGSFVDLFRNGTREGTVAIDSGGFKLEAVGSSTPLIGITNGAERLRIDSAGNVGIGTTSPVERLHVAKSAATGPSIYITNDSTGHTASDGLQIGYDGSNNVEFRNREATQTIFYNGNSEQMRINSSGYLGLGTSNPIYKLDVGNTTDLYTVIRGSNTSGITNSASILQLLTSDAGGSNIRYVNHSVSHTAQFYQLVGSSIPTFFCDFDSQIFRSNSGTEFMRVNSSGLGVNVSSPTQKIDVDGNILARDAGNTKGAYLSNDGCLEVYRAGSNAFIDFKTSLAEDYDCRIQQQSDGLAFSTGGSGASPERMRIDSSGLVGIGESSPTQMLVIRKDSAGTSSGEYPCIDLRNDNASGFNQIRFMEGGTENASIVSSNADNDLRFRTNAGNERMRIDSSGRIGIGATSLTAQFEVHTPAQALEPVRINDTNNTNAVTHRISFRTGGTEVGSVKSDRTSTSFNTSSDYRLKENVVDINDGITRIKQLQPKRFNFIADDTTTVDGFIAHEAQTVVPEAITGTHDEVDDEGNPVYQGIDQSKLVPLLTAALKEAIAKIETLEAEVTALKNN